MSSTNLLKDVLGSDLSQLNESEVVALSEKFNAKIEALLEARLEAKVQFATEVAESEAKEKYDALLKEHTDSYETTLEKISETVKEKSEAFKVALEEKTASVIATITEEKEQEVQSFKDYIIENLDVYLDKEVKTLLPESYIDDRAKAETLAPIVAGFKKVMEENYIKFDEENFGLLKEAKEELIKSRKEIERLTESSLTTHKDLVELKRNVKISKVCEGLDSTQRERAVRLLESCDVDMIEEKFSYIREEIINAPASRKEVVKESVVSTVKNASKVKSHQGEAVILDEDVNAPDELDMEDLTEDVSTPVYDEMDDYVSEFKKLIR